MQSPNICKTYWVLPSTLKVLPKFGTQRADTQPNIDGRGGVNPNLAASTVSTGVKPDVRATGIVVGQSKSHNKHCHKVSQFSSRAVWACDLLTVTSTLAPKAKRPLPVAVKYAHKHFENIWIADGSTLEALFRKLESLQDAPQGKLAGKLCTVIDLLIASTSVVSHQSTCTRYEFPGRFAQFHLPRPCWFSTVGFTTLDFFALNCQTSRFHYSDQIQCSVWSWANFEFRLHARDRLICFKTGDKNQPLLRLRLVEVRQGKTMYGYITSVLDPQVFHRMPLLTSTDDGGELKRLSILLNACWD